MENEKLISKNSGLSISSIIGIIGTIIVVFTLGIISIIYREPKTFTSNPSYYPSPLPNTDSGIENSSANSNFSQINLTDQTRMKEIITGVMQNTIPVTTELKNELRSIFTKYNATNTEIDNFATYGPAFVVVYQQNFFMDAFQAVSSGFPVKSDERLNIEKEALSRGLMTTERVKSNDNEMELIANHQPVIGSDGKQVIFTANTIKSTIDNLALVVDRLVLLFKF